MIKKLLSVFVVLFFVFSMFIGFGSAETLELTFSYDNGATYDSIYATLHEPYPDAGAYESACGNAFVAGVSGELRSISMPIGKVSSPSGAYTLYFGVVGEGSVALDTGLPAEGYTASSNIYLASDLTVGGEWVSFAFASGVNVVAGQSYVAYLVGLNETLSTTSYVRAQFKTNLNIDNVNAFAYVSGGWVALPVICSALNMRVYVDSDVVVTPTPVVTPVSNYPHDDPFVAVPSYYMVLLVLFAVVAVLAGLYVTYEKEQTNKGVALLFVLVGLVLFVVLIVGYFVGF